MQVEVRDVQGKVWLPSVQDCVVGFSSVLSTSLQRTLYFQYLL